MVLHSTPNGVLGATSWRMFHANGLLASLHNQTLTMMAMDLPLKHFGFASGYNIDIKKTFMGVFKVTLFLNTYDPHLSESFQLLQKQPIKATTTFFFDHGKTKSFPNRSIVSRTNEGLGIILIQ